MTSSSTQVMPHHTVRRTSFMQRMGRNWRRYLAAYAQAKAAEALYLSIARASDAELARRGTTREGLLRQVRQHLDLPA